MKAQSGTNLTVNFIDPTNTPNDNVYCAFDYLSAI
jgi:hypothetical protein